MTLREGLTKSINTVAVRLHMSNGVRKTVEAAQRLGIRSELRPDASLALGTSEVTLLELASAYGAFASGGRLIEPHIVRRVRTGSGRVLYQRPQEAAKIVVDRAARGRHQRHAELGPGLGHGAARRAACCIPPAARPAPPRSSATPGSSATPRTTSAASGWATTTATP